MASSAATRAQQKELKQARLQSAAKDLSDPLPINTPARTGRSSGSSLEGLTPPAPDKAAAAAAHEAAQRRLGAAGKPAAAAAAAPKPEAAAPETPRRPHEAKILVSPPGAPKTPALPPLLAAMLDDDEGAVRGVLEEDPAAARDLLWDHGVDPPLCWAVRRGCGAGVVRLLIEHGADVNAADALGMTPLSILGSAEGAEPRRDPLFPVDPWLPASTALLGCCCPLPGQVLDVAPGFGLQPLGEKVRRTLDISKLLTKAGADPTSVDAAGRRPIDLAIIHGNSHLELLWRGVANAEVIASEALGKIGAAGDSSLLGVFPW